MKNSERVLLKAEELNVTAELYDIMDTTNLKEIKFRLDNMEDSDIELLINELKGYSVVEEEDDMEALIKIYNEVQDDKKKKEFIRNSIFK